MEQSAKKWYKSKTMWLSILAFIGGLSGVLPVLEVVLSTKVYAIALAVTGAAGVALRAITKTKVTM